METSWNRPLVISALLFAGLAVLCGLGLLVRAQPIEGVHPALKPFKFAISIALFLGSFAFLIPRLSAEPRTQAALAWVLIVTMVAEIIPIVGQALRGTTSHFNVAAGLDSFQWRIMQLAIVVATAGLILIALVATARPLLGLSSLEAFAWRAGVWISLFGAVSGFRMGGSGTHSVGGPSGGAGLPLLNWSRVFGDLRVSHFMSLHALQIVPLAAMAASVLPWTGARWAVVLLTTVLVQALAGRPVW